MPIRSSVVGWVPNSACGSAGGSGSLIFRRARRRSNAMCAAGSRVSSSESRRRAPPPAATDPSRRRRARKPPAPPTARSPGRAAGAVLSRSSGETLAAADRLGQALRQVGACRGDDGEPGEAAQQVAMALVSESWATTWSTWSGEILHEVVVEHHPLGRAEAADIGVHRRRPAARVHPVDLPHLDVRLTRQREHIRAQLPLPKRLEAVEERGRSRLGTARSSPRRWRPRKRRPAATSGKSGAPARA